MIKELIFGVFCLSIATLNLTAQDETTGQRNSILTSDQAQLDFLIVPMMDKMFLSNVSHEIGKYNGMNFREVRSFFKDYITDLTALSALDNWQMNNLNDTTAKNVHMAIGYGYDLVKVPTRSEESRIAKIWEQLQDKKLDQKEERGAYLENGEIKEFYDGKSRFMNALPDTAWVFGKQLAHQEFDYILFLNELDIHKPRPTDPNFGSDERTLKLHFTLYDHEGKLVYGNAAFSTLSPDMLDIYEISNNALFSAINRMLAECSTHLDGILQNSK